MILYSRSSTGTLKYSVNDVFEIVSLMNQAVEDVVMIHNINFNMLRCQKATWWFWSNYLAAAHHQTRGTAGTQKLTIKEEEMSQRKANLYNLNLGDVGLVFQE